MFSKIMKREDWLNKRIIITRKDGSVRECEIMYDRNTKRYAFVNLTTHHVCECRFDTPEEAMQDLRNNEFVAIYKLSGLTHEQVEEIDKRIEKAQNEENARLQKAWDKAKDFPMNK